MKDLGHGANVEQIARMYNKNPKDIIDFSSNINPNVIPRTRRIYIRRITRK